MPIYQTLDELTVDYFTTHPEEVDEFVTEIFAEYAQDGDSAALLSALRSIARAKGISNIAEEANMSRQDVQKALSAKGNPRFDSINAIIHAMGFQLMPQKMGETAVAESRAEYKIK
ncbi:MAG: putative addiction module antidote protein [Chloroflexi bacterium]|nr:putative addiction module antidote protein [Chloroflexota bacterium]